MTQISIEPIIYQEMLTHPVLFSHRQPEKVAIISEPKDCLIEEILKHPTIKEVCCVTSAKMDIATTDSRINYHVTTPIHWAPLAALDHFDVCIITETSTPELISYYFKTLHADGILMQLSGSPFEVHTLKKMQKNLIAAGFSDIILFNFPQPHFPTGLRCAFMAKKTGIFKKIREKDIFNKSFTTHYYNFDIHKAALAMPEFLRQELIDALGESS